MLEAFDESSCLRRLLKLHVLCVLDVLRMMSLSVNELSGVIVEVPLVAGQAVHDWLLSLLHVRLDKLNMIPRYGTARSAKPLSTAR